MISQAVKEPVRIRNNIARRLRRHCQDAYGFLRRLGRWGSDPIGLIVAQHTAVRRARQTSHLRVAFAFGEAATGRPLPSGARSV